MYISDITLNLILYKRNKNDDFIPIGTDHESFNIEIGDVEITPKELLLKFKKLIEEENEKSRLHRITQSS